MLARHKESELAEIACVKKSKNLHHTLRNLTKHHDKIIINTGGQDSKEFHTALLAAHLLVTPIHPSQTNTKTLA